MAEKSNAALLYEIIDTLTDEEFKEFLDTLAIPADKVEVTEDCRRTCIDESRKCCI